MDERNNLQLPVWESRGFSKLFEQTSDRSNLNPSLSCQFLAIAIIFSLTNPSFSSGTGRNNSQSSDRGRCQGLLGNPHIYPQYSAKPR